MYCACDCRENGIAMQRRRTILPGMRTACGIVLTLSFLATGCAVSPTSPVCTGGSFTLGAAPTATPPGMPSHNDAPPGNQEKFNAELQPTAPAGCPVPEYIAIVDAQWTVSDPINVQISSAPDSNGVATCAGTTTGAVTVTATYTQDGVTKSATAPLTCY
jgi:hypothetical protein